MAISNRSLVYFQRRILFIILFTLVLYPFNSSTSRAQIVYQPQVLESEIFNLLPVADIEYFHSAGVEVQGRSREAVDFRPTENISNSSQVREIKRSLSESLSEKDYKLPNISYRARREVVTTVTAYNPVPEQTDSTPCLTANGTDICSEPKAIIAANWLPFGTKVQIPDYFGDKIFEVQDRMNQRYSDRVDVLMYDLDEAKKFGKRRLRIIVLE